MIFFTLFSTEQCISWLSLLLSVSISSFSCKRWQKQTMMTPVSDHQSEDFGKYMSLFIWDQIGFSILLIQFLTQQCEIVGWMVLINKAVQTNFQKGSWQQAFFYAKTSLMFEKQRQNIRKLSEQQKNKIKEKLGGLIRKSLNTDM